ncbi:MAG: Spy/CpxP family protein refolding chaperone [Prevotella sp.]|nr:Spy/CpxP family protein refolding chaperone [Prevotella sp.]
MKQLMMTMLLAIVAMTATAQDKKAGEINEKYFDARVSELVYRLDMSDDQKAKFTPIYKRYCEEMKALMGPAMKHKKEMKEMKDRQKGEKKQLTEEEKLDRTKKRMERQQQAQALRLKYIDEFATVLSAGQVNKFFEVERNIQKKLMDRKMHHKGKKDFKDKKVKG